MSNKKIVTDKEVFFDESDIIVSKTDTKGRITYANDIFLTIAGYTEKEVIGQPHNMIRHPDMPRAVFKLLWETIAAGSEIFAYVKNLTKAGDYYWVFAHVTPTFDSAGSILGFHSNRRVPDRECVKKMSELYGALRAEELRHADPRAGLAASTNLLLSILEKGGQKYEEFVFADVR